jgi:hypothetical protein
VRAREKAARVRPRERAVRPGAACSRCGLILASNADLSRTPPGAAFAGRGARLLAPALLRTFVRAGLERHLCSRHTTLPAPSFQRASYRAASSPCRSVTPAWFPTVFRILPPSWIPEPLNSLDHIHRTPSFRRSPPPAPLRSIREMPTKALYLERFCISKCLLHSGPISNRGRNVREPMATPSLAFRPLSLLSGRRTPHQAGLPGLSIWRNTRAAGRPIGSVPACRFLPCIIRIHVAGSPRMKCDLCVPPRPLRAPTVSVRALPGARS